MINIVFLDGFTLNPGDLDWHCFEKMGRFKVYDRTDITEVIQRSKDADILILNKTKLGEKEILKLPRLRLICVAATGYDVVDVNAASRKGIVVCNAAGYGTTAVAQMAIAHLLNITNRVSHYAEKNRNGFWRNSPDFCCWKEPLIGLENKRVAIVGFGSIGQKIAEMLRPFGVCLFAVSSKKELPADVDHISLEEAFRTCDIVSLNCPLTPDNEHVINWKLLEKANPHLILINTARGRLVNDEDLAKALKTNRIAAYCADVLSEEPPCNDNPLLHLPNAFITPHIAWATLEARQRILRIVGQNIETFLAGNPQNIVNKL